VLGHLQGNGLVVGTSIGCKSVGASVEHGLSKIGGVGEGAGNSEGSTSRHQISSIQGVVGWCW
jgi:hypothetical protein